MTQATEPTGSLSPPWPCRYRRTSAVNACSQAEGSSSRRAQRSSRSSAAASRGHADRVSRAGSSVSASHAASSVSAGSQPASTADRRPSRIRRRLALSPPSSALACASTSGAAAEPCSAGSGPGGSPVSISPNRTSPAAALVGGLVLAHATTNGDTRTPFRGSVSPPIRERALSSEEKKSRGSGGGDSGAGALA